MLSVKSTRPMFIAALAFILLLSSISAASVNITINRADGSPMYCELLNGSGCRVVLSNGTEYAWGGGLNNTISITASGTQDVFLKADLFIKNASVFFPNVNLDSVGAISADLSDAKKHADLLIINSTTYPIFSADRIDDGMKNIFDQGNWQSIFFRLGYTSVTVAQFDDNPTSNDYLIYEDILIGCQNIVSQTVETAIRNSNANITACIQQAGKDFIDGTWTYVNNTKDLGAPNGANYNRLIFGGIDVDYSFGFRADAMESAIFNTTQNKYKLQSDFTTAAIGGSIVNVIYSNITDFPFSTEKYSYFYFESASGTNQTDDMPMFFRQTFGDRTLTITTVISQTNSTPAPRIWARSLPQVFIGNSLKDADEISVINISEEIVNASVSGRFQIFNVDGQFDLISLFDIYSQSLVTDPQVNQLIGSAKFYIYDAKLGRFSNAQDANPPFALIRASSSTGNCYTSPTTTVIGQPVLIKQITTLPITNPFSEATQPNNNILYKQDGFACYEPTTITYDYYVTDFVLFASWFNDVKLCQDRIETTLSNPSVQTSCISAFGSAANSEMVIDTDNYLFWTNLTAGLTTNAIEPQSVLREKWENIIINGKDQYVPQQEVNTIPIDIGKSDLRVENAIVIQGINQNQTFRIGLINNVTNFQISDPNVTCNASILAGPSWKQFSLSRNQSYYQSNLTMHGAEFNANQYNYSLTCTSPKFSDLEVSNRIVEVSSINHFLWDCNIDPFTMAPNDFFVSQCLLRGQPFDQMVGYSVKLDVSTNSSNPFFIDLAFRGILGDNYLGISDTRQFVLRSFLRNCLNSGCSSTGVVADGPYSVEMIGNSSGTPFPNFTKDFSIIINSSVTTTRPSVLSVSHSVPARGYFTTGEFYTCEALIDNYQQVGALQFTFTTDKVSVIDVVRSNLFGISKSINIQQPVTESFALDSCDKRGTHQVFDMVKNVTITISNICYDAPNNYSMGTFIPVINKDTITCEVRIIDSAAPPIINVSSTLPAPFLRTARDGLSGEGPDYWRIVTASVAGSGIQDLVVNFGRWAFENILWVLFLLLLIFAYVFLFT